MKKIRLGVFISGRGSNAKNIFRFFENHTQIEVAKIITNNRETPLFHDEKIGKIIEFRASKVMMGEEEFVDECRQQFDYIILAGYLKLIPENLLQAFPDKIINIHPALLPNYGGKGMYGVNVHQRVFENKDKVSGITIHLIDKEFDRGNYLAQFFTSVEACTSPQEIADKVLKLEHAYFATVIEKTILMKENR